MSKKTWIGHVAQHGETFMAVCGRCTWKLRKRKQDDAESLLRSHNRIAHRRVLPVYLEEPKQ